MICSNYIAMVEYDAETGIIRDIRTKEVLENVKTDPLWRGCSWDEKLDVYKNIVRIRLNKIPLTLGGMMKKYNVRSTPLSSGSGRGMICGEFVADYS